MTGEIEGSVQGTKYIFEVKFMYLQFRATIRCAALECLEAAPYLPRLHVLLLLQFS